MRAFTRIRSRALPLPVDDIDTDAILPARFLLLLSKEDFGTRAFHDVRSRTGAIAQALEDPAYLGAQVIVAGERMGIGSSREQAVWALDGLGIRCIIAKSFGEIFHANCINNGILPVTMSGGGHSAAMQAAKSGQFLTIDLENLRIGMPAGAAFGFDLDSKVRQFLLAGQDETEQILAEHLDAIAAFEHRRKQDTPWLRIDRVKLAPFLHHLAPRSTP